MTFGSVFLGFVIVVVGAFLPLLCSSFPTILNLERAFPIHHLTNLSHVVERDRARHNRSLLQSNDGVIDYTLEGTWDTSVGKLQFHKASSSIHRDDHFNYHYIVTKTWDLAKITRSSLPSLYYTRVQLGTPPSDFYVQVDTGSDVTWVGCVHCTDCPKTTGIPNISLRLYNPKSSSSASICSSDNNVCTYSVNYADKSRTSGFYVRDLLNYDRMVGNSRTLKSTASFVFGCTTVEIGFSSSSSRTDGILGLGHRPISLISQLSAQGLSPKAFSHCLRGDGDGGGVLVLGEIVEPNIVYSPLIPSQPHYNLDLQGISVNGQTLLIDPSKLSSSGERGAIVDSGTTLVYLAIEALVQVNSAIKASTSAPYVPTLFNYPCYRVESSIAEVFPQVSFHCAGGADLVLGPQDYLLYQGLMEGSHLWCMGFRQALVEDRQTVLGDLVLKNRFFVYDLVGQRIGWTNYNCSAAVNVSVGVKPRHGGRSNTVRSSVSLQFVLWITTFTTFVLILSVYSIRWL